MKKISIVLLLGLFFSIGVSAQTSGTLTVTTTTSATAGEAYAPNNILAIWIEDASGNFVKTLMCYASERITYLNTWKANTMAAGSVYNRVDAITGATKSSHGTRTCTWNGKNYSGAVVPDGQYKVCMELTDKHVTGNFSTFTITKNTSSSSITPANVPSFSSISINWVPNTSDVEEIDFVETYNIFPNPTSGLFEITGENIQVIEVINTIGQSIYKGNSAIVDITSQAKGIYLVMITTDKGTITKKVLKN
jgi:hypothetical protein